MQETAPVPRAGAFLVRISPRLDQNWCLSGTLPLTLDAIQPRNP
ncbi:hypothetical protein [Ruegeria atlantica]|nr:hypothetical protein [Ruegeria atlantica]